MTVTTMVADDEEEGRGWDRIKRPIRKALIPNLMRNGAGSSSSWLERGGSLWGRDCNGGGRGFENTQRGGGRKNAQEL